MTLTFVMKGDLGLDEKDYQYIAEETGKFFAQLAEQIGQLKKRPPGPPPTFIIPNQKHIL